jgi:hemerythrin
MQRGQRLTWSESFAVGHEALDSEHRSLVDAINEVAAAARDTPHSERLASALGALREKAIRHTSGENALLWELKSGTYELLRGRLQAPRVLKAMAESAFDLHMARHDELLARLDTIIAGPVDALDDSLKTWFVEHAVKHDLPLKAIFQTV